MKQPKILLLGEFFRDIYHIGEASTLSAEVPIPVVKITETKRFPGGAGNVQANFQSLGGTCIYPLPPSHWPPLKNRLMVGDHQLARWDEDDWVEPYTLTGLRLLGDEKFDAVVISDYCKGAITREVVEWVAANFKGLPIFVDTKRNPLFYGRLQPLYFPNLKEYTQYENEYKECRTVLKKGPQGLVISWNGQTHTLPALASYVRSTNGAGDSVLAGYVYKYLTGTDICVYHHYEAALFASEAAAIAVSKPYTSTVTLEEIEAFDARAN